MTLFTYRNIPIRLHSSFLWLAALLVGWELLTSGLGSALNGVLLGVAVFGSVLLHELGHAMAGRVFGLATRDITLYPFGGIASMQVPEDRPMVEGIVAVAGPAVNFALAGLGAVAAAAGIPGAGTFVLLNLGLGVFNLLPAYPMDGGRVLRAWWSLRTGPVKATLRALRLSRGMAWLMIAGGIVLQSTMALVGLFLLVATRQEQRRWEAVQARAQQAHRWVNRSGLRHPVAV